MTKIEQKQDELIKSLKELVNLCDAPQYFEIIAAKKAMKEIVEHHESELSSLKAMEGEDVSDEDIKVWALCKSPESVLHYAGLVEGAKAHRDGLIPASGKAQIKEQKCKRKQDNSDGICPDCGKDHYEGRSV